MNYEGIRVEVEEQGDLDEVHDVSIILQAVYGCTYMHDKT